MSIVQKLAFATVITVIIILNILENTQWID